MGGGSEGVAGTGEVKENTVNLYGGTFNNVWGGVNRQGGAQGGDVSDNTVNITGASTKVGFKVLGGDANRANVRSNTVVITGGEFGAGANGVVINGGKHTGD